MDPYLEALLTFLLAPALLRLMDFLAQLEGDVRYKQPLA